MQNGEPTIRIKPNVKNAIDCLEEDHDMSKGLTEWDVKKINTLYNCQGYPQLFENIEPKRHRVDKSVEKDCKNDETYCKEWSELGHCDHSVYGPFMKKFCKFSCNVCNK